MKCMSAEQCSGIIILLFSIIFYYYYYNFIKMILYIHELNDNDWSIIMSLASSFMMENRYSVHGIWYLVELSDAERPDDIRLIRLFAATQHHITSSDVYISMYIYVHVNQPLLDIAFNERLFLFCYELILFIRRMSIQFPHFCLQ